ncbi:DUF6769 family protein [uncultured Parabacteroides sp.]|uniref:DUF6769 family protein n=1 Tax=uncultured Parabacteroides sp. TaxID=512312 RepID=UPI00342183FA
MRAKRKIYQYVMLLVSVVVLLSVVVPHHHHSNGLPCYKSLSTEAAHGGHGSSESHDCGCNGHNIALYTSIFSHTTDGDASQYLFPLLVLFDYINPPVPEFYKLLFEKDRSFYIESLHDTWITSASGLRAPPFYV